MALGYKNVKEITLKKIDEIFSSEGQFKYFLRKTEDIYHFSLYNQIALLAQEKEGAEVKGVVTTFESFKEYARVVKKNQSGFRLLAREDSKNSLIVFSQNQTTNCKQKNEEGEVPSKKIYKDFFVMNEKEKEDFNVYANTIADNNLPLLVEVVLVGNFTKATGVTDKERIKNSFIYRSLKYFLLYKLGSREYENVKLNMPEFTDKREAFSKMENIYNQILKDSVDFFHNMYVVSLDKEQILRNNSNSLNNQSDSKEVVNDERRIMGRDRDDDRKTRRGKSSTNGDLVRRSTSLYEGFIRGNLQARSLQSRKGRTLQENNITRRVTRIYRGTDNALSRRSYLPKDETAIYARSGRGLHDDRENVLEQNSTKVLTRDGKESFGVSTQIHRGYEETESRGIESTNEARRGNVRYIQENKPNQPDHNKYSNGANHKRSNRTANNTLFESNVSRAGETALQVEETVQENIEQLSIFSLLEGEKENEQDINRASILISRAKIGDVNCRIRRGIGTQLRIQRQPYKTAKGIRRRIRRIDKHIANTKEEKKTLEVLKKKVKDSILAYEHLPKEEVLADYPIYEAIKIAKRREKKLYNTLADMLGYEKIDFSHSYTNAYLKYKVPDTDLKILVVISYESFYRNGIEGLRLDNNFTGSYYVLCQMIMPNKRGYEERHNKFFYPKHKDGISAKELSKFIKTEAKIYISRAEARKAEQLSKEVENTSSFNAETIESSEIGLKVGYEFILVDKDNITDISITNTSNEVIVDNVKYPLFIGESFDDSTKIDKLIDSRDFRVYKLNDYLKNDEIDLEKEEKSIENSSEVGNDKEQDVVVKLDDVYKVFTKETIDKELKDCLKEEQGELILNNDKYVSYLEPISSEEAERVKTVFDDDNYTEFILDKDEQRLISKEHREEQIEELGDVKTVLSLLPKDYEKIPERQQSQDKGKIKVYAEYFSPINEETYYLTELSKDKINARGYVLRNDKLENISFNLNTLREEGAILNTDNDYPALLEEEIVDLVSKTDDLNLDENLSKETVEEEENREEVNAKDALTTEQKVDYAEDFNLENEEFGKPLERFENNIKAIKTLKQIQKENRNASKEEQEILSKYVGFGGLDKFFSKEKYNQQLKALLTKEEYNQALRSINNAHYTPLKLLNIFIRQ